MARITSASETDKVASEAPLDGEKIAEQAEEEVSVQEDPVIPVDYPPSVGDMTDDVSSDPHEKMSQYVDVIDQPTSAAFDTAAEEKAFRSQIIEEEKVKEIEDLEAVLTSKRDLSRSFRGEV